MREVIRPETGIEFHAHDDTGCAIANALVAVQVSSPQATPLAHVARNAAPPTSLPLFPFLTQRPARRTSTHACSALASATASPRSAAFSPACTPWTRRPSRPGKARPDKCRATMGRARGAAAARPALGRGGATVAADGAAHPFVSPRPWPPPFKLQPAVFEPPGKIRGPRCPGRRPL